MYSLINIQTSHTHNIHMYVVYLCCSFLKRKGERYTTVATLARLATSGIFAAFVQFCVRLKCRWVPRDKYLAWPGPRRNLTNRNQDKLWVRARCHMGVWVCVYGYARQQLSLCRISLYNFGETEEWRGCRGLSCPQRAWERESCSCMHAVIDTIRSPIPIPIPCAQHRL